VVANKISTCFFSCSGAMPTVRLRWLTRQGLARHSRNSSAMGIYAQIVPEGQHRAVEQMGAYARKAIADSGTVVILKKPPSVQATRCSSLYS
jgi:hypothetical protein